MLGTIGIIVIASLGAMFLVFLYTLIRNVFDCKKSSDEEEKKQLKSEMKISSIILSCLIIALVGSIIGTSVYFKKGKLYEYKDVTSVAETVETLYEVNIERVVSEKDKEPLYYITLLNNKMVGSTPDILFSVKKENHPLYKRTGDIFIMSEKVSEFYSTASNTFCFDEIKLVLSESEYEFIIGLGNNHLRMEVHILTLNTEKFHGKDHSVVLYRLGCFGEAFSEDEIKELSERFLHAANAQDCEGVFSDDVEADFVVIHY